MALKFGAKFIVERCEECYEILLDRLELEDFLERIWKYQRPEDSQLISELLEIGTIEVVRCGMVNDQEILLAIDPE